MKSILAKHIDSGGQLLISHLKDVAEIAAFLAPHLGFDPATARKGGLLHDIGKTSPLFQKTLEYGYMRPPNFVFRHEIASLFFLSLLAEEEKPYVLEMIVAHHKSLFNDVGEKGFLDLVDKMDGLENDCFMLHYRGFEEWSPIALQILWECGLDVHPISKEEAYANYQYALKYCENLPLGYSAWKGLLMTADHFASALGETSTQTAERLFKVPDLSYYENRKHPLYPLSSIGAKDIRPHTVVTAPTGAGKTDFLLRRCKNRVFYTLPFQASINAMYERLRADLHYTGCEIQLLHSASSLKVENGKIEERILQRHPGASVKVLTPHQMASIAFGIKGYESMILDLKGCDIILDEIHTYSETIQAIVLKIVEILVSLDCRIHIGTATMPSLLYRKILTLLGGPERVYEVELDESTLGNFNRHIIYKKESFEETIPIIEENLRNRQKILMVCNQVKSAQQLYKQMDELFPDIPKMLIHSRFERGDRQRLETELKERFNQLTEACIVVSTQVVEVSLDISFDLMITDCAPIDALVQRFGRINRKRTADTIRQYKPIYVLAPPLKQEDAYPYQLDVLRRTYEILPDQDVFYEKEVRGMLDVVFPDDRFINIDLTSIYSEREWQITTLCHNPKSALLETLDIDSVTCITEENEEEYRSGKLNDRSKFEIPLSFKSIAYRNLRICKEGMRPFIIPNQAYSKELGLLIEFAKPENYKTFEIL